MKQEVRSEESGVGSQEGGTLSRCGAFAMSLAHDVASRDRVRGQTGPQAHLARRRCFAKGDRTPRISNGHERCKLTHHDESFKLMT